MQRQIGARLPLALTLVRWVGVMWRHEWLPFALSCHYAEVGSGPVSRLQVGPIFFGGGVFSLLASKLEYDFLKKSDGGSVRYCDYLYRFSMKKRVFCRFLGYFLTPFRLYFSCIRFSDDLMVL